MYKILVTLSLVVLCGAQHRVRSKRSRDVIADINRVSQKFPEQEWRDFFDELKAALEGTESRLDHNFGQDADWTREGMNGTMNRLKETLGDRFDRVKSAWERAEAKMDEVTQDLRKITMADVVEAIKDQFSGYVNDIDTEDGQRTLTNFERRWNDFLDRIRGE